MFFDLFFHKILFINNIMNLRTKNLFYLLLCPVKTLQYNVTNTIYKSKKVYCKIITQHYKQRQTGGVEQLFFIHQYYSLYFPQSLFSDNGMLIT